VQLRGRIVVYITLVITAGAVIAGYCFWRYPIGGDWSDWLLIGAFAAMTLLTDRYRLQIAPRTNIHLDTIPLFAAVLIFDPAEAVLIAAVGRFFGRLGPRIVPLEHGFNLMQTVVYVGAGALLLNAFAPTPWMPGGLASWLGLLVTVLVMYSLNALLVMGIVALHARTSPIALWRASQPLETIVQGVMYCLGLLTALVVVPHNWAVLLIALPTIAVFITLDRTLKMEAQQRKLSEENAAQAADLRKQATALREAYAVLEDALDAKNQMLQNVSHELRTPLVPITGFAEALREGLCGDLTAEQLTAVDHIFRHATHMAQMVNDLLALQTLDRQHLQLAEVKVADLLQDCITTFSRRAASVGIELRSECAADVPPLRGDAMRLEEVISNLLDNAIKFSPYGGEIVLKAVGLDDKSVQISVSDQGIGIPAEELPKIYRRFYQVDGSSTRKFGGQGMGLAIAKRIVEIHGGKITATSQVGKGSTFYVVLPTELVADAPAAVSFD